MERALRAFRAQAIGLRLQYNIVMCTNNEHVSTQRKRWQESTSVRPNVVGCSDIKIKDSPPFYQRLNFKTRSNISINKFTKLCLKSQTYKHKEIYLSKSQKVFPKISRQIAKLFEIIRQVSRQMTNFFQTYSRKCPFFQIPATFCYEMAKFVQIFLNISQKIWKDVKNNHTPNSYSFMVSHTTIDTAISMSFVSLFVPCSFPSVLLFLFHFPRVPVRYYRPLPLPLDATSLLHEFLPVFSFLESTNVHSRGARSRSTGRESLWKVRGLSERSGRVRKTASRCSRVAVALQSRCSRVAGDPRATVEHTTRESVCLWHLMENSTNLYERNFSIATCAYVPVTPSFLAIPNNATRNKHFFSHIFFFFYSFMRLNFKKTYFSIGIIRKPWRQYHSGSASTSRHAYRNDNLYP